MKCPKCGYLRQSRDHIFAPPTECPACGVIYAKYGPNDLLGSNAPLDIATGLKKPSPVHEASLKQARERVERRLRKKINPIEKDELREQTLQRARMFVSEGVKRRQEEWRSKESRSQDDSGDEPLDAGKDGEEFVETMAELSAQDQWIDSGDGHAQERPPETTEDSLLEEAAAEPEQTALPDTEIEEIHAQASEPTEPYAHESETISAEQTGQSLSEAELNEEHCTDAFTSEDEKESQNYVESDENMVEPQAIGIDAYPDQAPLRLSSSESTLTRSHRLKTKKSNGGLMRMLPAAVAWLILVAGVVGAVLSWTTLTDVQAGLWGVGPGAGNSLPIALLLGFAYLATGVLGFSFFWVSSIINSHLKEIRRIVSQPRMETRAHSAQ